MTIVRRRFSTTDPNQLLSIVVRVFSSGYESIIIKPGEVTAKLLDTPPEDPSLKDLLGDDDIVIIPAPDRAAVMEILWRHCNRLKLVPYRCIVGGRAAAEWLGMSAVSQMVWGIPVRMDDTVDMDDVEFMFLLADNYYGPIRRVKKVIHGRVGEG